MRHCLSLSLFSLLLYIFAATKNASAAAAASYGHRVLTRTVGGVGPRISSGVVRRAASRSPVRYAKRPLYLKTTSKGWFRHRHRHPHKSFRETVSNVVTNHDPNDICRKDGSNHAVEDKRPSIPILLVQGMAEIALEAASGFVVGYVLGCVTSGNVLKGMLVPKRFATRRNPAVTGMIQRTIQTHAKGLQNAKSWGKMSAVFGTFQVATQMVRNNVDDEWNYIIGSAAAGAYFARRESMVAMLRSAVSYGGLVYFLSGAIPWLATERISSAEKYVNPFVPFF